MKRLILTLSLSFSMSLMYGQLTLEECQRKTQQNYPLVHRYGLIEKTKEYSLENAGKGYLPQFSLSAKATYQSDVTALPVSMPGVNIKGLPKDQYQVTAELKQNIWDGGEISMRKKQAAASSTVEQEQLNVDMYALNSRVNDLFFGVLLLDEQLQQNRLLQEQLERTFKQVSAYLDGGLANSADLDAVKVEQLSAKQKEVELTYSRQAYLKMLALLVGEELTETTTLVRPTPEGKFFEEVRRPELSLFDAQADRLNIQEKTLKTGYRPRLGLFVQGMYGNPGLNMLEDKFKLNYMAGVRFSWNFGSLYTLKNDRKMIDADRERVFNNKEVFLFNTRLQVSQQSSAIAAMEQQMRDDEEIIRLRTNIRKAAEAKVANGTMTVIDMLREITNENMARQNKSLHGVQLLKNIYQLKYTTNN